MLGIKTTIRMLALTLSLVALNTARAQPSESADHGPSSETFVLIFPFLPPLLLLEPVLETPPATGDVTATGTESFELLEQEAAQANAGRLEVPEGIFLQSRSDKERSERIARDALPRKEDPNLLEGILVPLAAVALQALDANN